MKEIKTLDEFNQAISGNGLQVVKFSASWCAPCKMLTRTINEIESSCEGVNFYEIDVDAADEELIDQYQIQNIPVMLFFNEGLQIDRVVGARSKKDLLMIIEKNK